MVRADESVGRVLRSHAGQDQGGAPRGGESLQPGLDWGRGACAAAAHSRPEQALACSVGRQPCSLADPLTRTVSLHLARLSRSWSGQASAAHSSCASRHSSAATRLQTWITAASPIFRGLLTAQHSTRYSQRLQALHRCCVTACTSCPAGADAELDPSITEVMVHRCAARQLPCLLLPFLVSRQSQTSCNMQLPGSSAHQ